MRTILAIFVVMVIVVGISSAEVPTSMNYQGLLKDSGGNPVADASYSVVFTIYDADVAGNSKWTEIQTVNTSNGLFAVLLGTINPIEDSVFNQATRFLGIKVDTDPELTPRTMMVTIPYSYRVSTIDGASGGNITSKVSIGTGHDNSGDNAFVAGIGNIATGSSSSISGGANNQATGSVATIAGGGENVATSSSSTIAGGYRNVASSSDATIGGGYADTASGFRSTVAGGAINMASDSYATVSGGEQNTASARSAVVSGGFQNTASGIDATIGGGFADTASGRAATISGGGSNSATETNSTVSGGSLNAAHGEAATVGGGVSDTASGIHSTVSGGLLNSAFGRESTISGGTENVAEGWASTISGGEQNFCFSNHTVISGGAQNEIYGQYSMIPGGYNNRASGDFCFAAGRVARATHTGSFVWADSSLGGFETTDNNQFLIRSKGGVGINTNSPGVELEVNGIARVGDHVWPTTGEGMELAYNPTSDIGYIHVYDRELNTWGTLNLGNGDVGIGTSTPNYKLDVRGTIGNNATLHHSDKRWKDNIETLNHSLDKVQKLRGVSFDWKRDEFTEMNFPEGKQIGLIAQEVEQVLPELVNTADDGYKSVDYSKLVALLIEANKEQQQQIDELKKMVQQLTDQNKLSETTYGSN